MQKAEAWKLRIKKEGYWVIHSTYLLAAWRSEIANDDTRQGYKEWVYHQIEAEEIEEQYNA